MVLSWDVLSWDEGGMQKVYISTPSPTPVKSGVAIELTGRRDAQSFTYLLPPSPP